MSPSRTYTIRLARPMLILSPDKGQMKTITELRVTVQGEDPYRAPELDLTHVAFRTEEDGDLFGVSGQVDKPSAD